MATHIFPSVNDVNAGTAGKGKTLTEANLRKRAPIPYADRNYVKSGAAGTNAGSLNLNVAAGVYCIEGYYVEKDATETVALTASSTCRVWLQLVKDGSGNVTGTSWVVRTDATTPSGEPAALVALVITGASTITTIYDSRRGVLVPGSMVAGASGNYNAVIGTSYTGIQTLSRVHVQSGKSYIVSGVLVWADGNSGSSKKIDMDIQYGGVSIAGGYPATGFGAPYVAGDSNKYAAPFEIPWVPGADGTSDLILVAKATAAGSVVVYQNSLIVRAA